MSLPPNLPSQPHPSSMSVSGDLTPVPPSFSQVEKLVKYLDPNDLGRINFKDFCRGVFAMKGESVVGTGLPGSCPAEEAGLTWVSAGASPVRAEKERGSRSCPSRAGVVGRSLIFCHGVPTSVGRPFPPFPSSVLLRKFPDGFPFFPRPPPGHLPPG